MPRGKRKALSVTRSGPGDLMRWALTGIEREIAETRARLESLTREAAQMRKRVGRAATAAWGELSAPTGTDKPAAAGTRRRRKHNLTPEARKRLSERMKKRWDEYRKQKSKLKR